MNPNGMYDMAGWTEVSCHAREAIFRGGSGLFVASSLTDPDGHHSSGVVFTEWWWRNQYGEIPALRDYRYGKDEPCQHYVASSVLAATEEPA